MSDGLSQRLAMLMRRAGYNPRSLALAASLGPTAVRDIIEGRVASPRYATLRPLAAVLGVGVDYLAMGEAAPVQPVPTQPVPTQPVPTQPGPAEPARPQSSAAAAAGDLPVYGAAQGGSEGAMQVSSDPIQWLARPDPLRTVAGAYGVFVVGESMSPAYEQGDIALVHPSLPPRRGADVVLSRQDPDGTRHSLVKRLVGWSDEAWRVRQYNPPSEFDLPRAQWRDVQAIVGKYNAR